MLARNRAILLTGLLGLAALIAIGDAAPGFAASANEAAKSRQKIGRNCAHASKANPGTLCMFRANVSSSDQLHYRLSFDGTATHFNVQRAKSRREIAADGSGKSQVLTERAKAGDVVQVKVQACTKRNASRSSCSNWVVLTIIK